MALSTTNIDTYRGTSGVSLPADLSNEIIAAATEESAIMRLVPRVALSGRGVAIPVVLGDAEAAWVGETHEKAVGKPTLQTKLMRPYKLALIELFSDEFRRDIPSLYDALQRRLPAAIARKFDSTVFFGTAPGSDFDTLASVAVDDVTAANVYAGIVGSKAAVATAGGDLNGWAVAPQGEAILLNAQDGAGHLIFTNGIDGFSGRLVGDPAIKTRAAYNQATGCYMVGGDWNMARWGIVGDIEISIADQATINDGTQQVNLWQRNMFAVRVEAELGFVHAGGDYFVKLGVSNGD